MTVEVETQETEQTQEEVKKTPAELAKAMYPDDVPPEEGQEGETKEGDETKKEVTEEVNEETKEQEETKDREDSEAEEAREDVTLTLSKDSLLEKSDLADLEAYANEKELSQKEAESVLQFAEKQKADHEASGVEWAKQVDNDPDIGGENTDRTNARIKLAMDRFGDEDVSAFFNETLLGNHPTAVKLFERIGAAMEDDRFITGEPPKGPKKSRAERMYPNDVNKE